MEIILPSVYFHLGLNDELGRIIHADAEVGLMLKQRNHKTCLQISDIVISVHLYFGVLYIVDLQG